VPIPPLINTEFYTSFLRRKVARLAISQQNLHYYADLAIFYTVYDLRRLKSEQTHLYLLCYAWQRYRQLTDNLVDALGYHMKQLEDESKVRTNKHFVAEQVRRQQETPQVGRLLLLFVDETVADATPFGDVRQRAFQIMAKDALETTGQRLSENLKVCWPCAGRRSMDSPSAASATCARSVECSIFAGSHRTTHGSRRSPG
jgi:hypothetical protein